MNSPRILTHLLNLRRCIFACASVLALVTLTSCGGNGTSNDTATAVIGPAGGILVGPDGTQVVVPAGALDQPTTIRIARSASGAPATLPEGNPPAGPIYEFTPHGLIFNTPVKIRMPVPANAVGTEVFMASPGEEWQLNDATVTNGIAEWQRNSFSWGMIPYACAIAANNTDPYPCAHPRGWASASATPSSAITQVSPSNYFNSAGSWVIIQAGIVNLTLNYQAAPDCGDASNGPLTGHVKLLHWDPAAPLNTPNRVQTLLDQTVTLTSTQVTLPPGAWSTGGGPTFRGEGSTTFDVSPYLTAATNAFGFSFSCNRPGRPTQTGGDLITFIGAMPAPSVTYTIAGTIIGLTGSGLVLHNGAENLPVSTGSFTFATAIASGASYNVSVQTPPSGQACTVTNGSGTASGNVTNVTVTCIASKAWQGATLIETGNGDLPIAPTIAMDPNGNAFAIWVQNGSGSFPDIWTNRYVAGTGWETATLMELTDSNVDIPSIAVQANGNAIAVWPQTDGTRLKIWASRYVVGTGWITPVLIETDNAGNAYAPSIAIDPNGNAMAVWAKSDGTRLNIWANRYDAVTGWGIATLIENDNGNVLIYPRVAMDANGNAIAVWTQSDGTHYNAMANRYVANVGWGTATLIETDNTGHVAYPTIAMDANGNAIAVWAQSDGTRYNVWTNRYVVGSGWGTAALLENDNAGDANPGPVVMDANGNAMVAWSQSDGTRINVWARRYDVVTDWGPATLIENDNGDAGTPSIAMNASGDAIAVWHQSDGTRNNIWANRFAAGTGWGTPSLIETDDIGDALYPIVVMSTGGNAVATWVQWDGSRNNVWANVFK
jgi:hypothetical protein